MISVDVFISFEITLIVSISDSDIEMSEYLSCDKIIAPMIESKYAVHKFIQCSSKLKKGINIELNGPGGLFGHVHSQLVSAIPNTSYYEYFPNGSRDLLGKEIGLINPPIPKNGSVALPDHFGWGAEWDWKYFEKKRLSIL